MLLCLRGRGSLFFLLLLSIASCDVSLPGTLVGESTHFRLFLDPALDPGVLAYYQSHDELAALETDFADKRTMLKTPDGQKIDYHLMTPADISAACGFGTLDPGDPESGCAVNHAQAIAAAYIPHQHELMHAYMALVFPDAMPIPFLEEGIAQALGCGTQIGTSVTEDAPSWEEAIMAEATDPAEDVYIQGGLFARYLIRTEGIDAYLRYYAQAPAARDPAIFAANFSAFWSMSMDEVWSAMHTLAPGAAAIDGQICPCSLGVLPTDGQLITNDAFSQPYWTLPGTYGSSIALTVPSGDVIVQDCEGVAPVLATSTMDLPVPPGSAAYPDGVVAIVEVTDAHPRYVVAPISRASVGEYLVDDCATGDPYPVPADFLSLSGNVWALTDQSTTAALTKYLQLELPAATQLVGAEHSGGVCADCSFGLGATGTCDPASTPTAPNLFGAGPVNTEFIFPALPAGTAVPAPVTGLLQFFH